MNVQMNWDFDTVANTVPFHRLQASALQRQSDAFLSEQYTVIPSVDGDNEQATNA
jgi:hypothetical protein